MSVEVQWANMIYQSSAFNSCYDKAAVQTSIKSQRIANGTASILRPIDNYFGYLNCLIINWIYETLAI